MDSTCTLHTFLPDIQSAMSDVFQSVECSIDVSPHLCEPPFDFKINSLGKRVRIQTKGSPIADDFHLIKSTSEGDIVTDGLTGDTIHLILEAGDCWQIPLQAVFIKSMGPGWSYLVLELCNGVADFHILTAETKPLKHWMDCVVLWVIPLVTESKSKPKVIKRIVKKPSPEKGLNGTVSVASKSTKPPSGSKLLRKKVDSPTATVNGAAETSETTKKASNEISVKPDEANCGDSGIYLTDSDTEKSSKSGKDSEMVYKENGAHQAGVVSDGCSVQQKFTTNIEKIDEIQTAQEGIVDRVGQKSQMITPNEANLPRNDSAKQCEGEMENKGIPLENGKKTNLKISTEPMQMSILPPMVKAPCNASTLSCHNYGQKSDVTLIDVKRSAFPANSIVQLSTVSRQAGELSVQILQLAFRKLTYEELCDMRHVHPHWDGICGQILNNGYYEVIKKADELLVDCQRRVRNEPDLHEIVSQLTSIQVHIFNPIDILRPAIDEGVCCFPYGRLLDKLFIILNDIENVMKGNKSLNVDWKSISALAQRAQFHCKLTMQNFMEERLGEVIQVKAIQQLQRIDSFMIESTVSKLEKAAHVAKGELEWEIEQLRLQNIQLKRDNRELKKDFMRLESRVESIERRFKTMARLLQ